MTGTKRSERHRSLWLLLACLVAVAMFAAACGDDDDTASASDDGASDDGASDDGASDDGASDDGASDDGASDDGAADDGAADDGASDDGAADDGAADDGAADDGSSDGYMSTVGAIATEDYVADLEPAGDYTIGFGSIGREIDFHVTVEEGHESAAADAGVDLVVLDNAYDAAQAVENARTFINQGVDAVIEYQCDTPTNDVIADLMEEAAIPIVAIDCPVPGAPFFGGNNTVAGTLGGEKLGEIFLDRGWAPDATALVLLEFTPAGEINDLRMQGYEDGFLAQVPDFPADQIVRLDVNDTEDALNKMRQWLSGNSEFENVLVGSIEDGRALGAHQALQAANKQDTSVIVSQGCDGVAQGLIRGGDPIFVGSVDYGPANYGFFTISLALDILAGEPVPEELFVPHVNCEAATIDELYPA